MHKCQEVITWASLLSTRACCQSNLITRILHRLIFTDLSAFIAEQGALLSPIIGHCGSLYLTIIHRDHHDYDVPVLHWCLAYNTNGLVHPAFYMSASPPGSLPGSSWCHWTGWPYEVAATTTGTQHQTLLQVLCHALQGNNNTVENRQCVPPSSVISKVLAAVLPRKNRSY